MKFHGRIFEEIFCQWNHMEDGILENSVSMKIHDEEICQNSGESVCH